MEIKDNKTAHSSSGYDGQIRKTIPYYDHFHSETIRLVKAVNPAPKIWLDTGCGTGTLVETAGKNFPETKFVLADPSRDMLSIAGQKLSDKKNNILTLEPTGTEFLNWTLEEKPDVITAVQSHHYLQADERKKAVQKCFDLLNEGSVFITFENIRPLTENGVEIGKKCWGNFQESCGKSREDIEKHLSRFGKEYFPITIEEHLNLYRKNRF